MIKKIKKWAIRPERLSSIIVEFLCTLLYHLCLSDNNKNNLSIMHIIPVQTCLLCKVDKDRDGCLLEYRGPRKAK